MFDDVGLDFSKDEKENEEDFVPLPNINSDTLSKVLEWATHHKNDPESTDEDEHDTDIFISTWDSEFLNVSTDTLFQLIAAANYLNIKRLFNIVCQAVANMMKGKSPVDLRRIFHIKNDLNPQQEKRIRRENQWCEEHN